MKVRLKRTLTGFKRDTAATFQELKKDFEPVKPVIQFVRLVVLFVTPVVGLWPISQTLAIGYAIVGIVVLARVYRVPVISALKGPNNDFGTAVTRSFLLIFSTGASIFLFMVAIIGDESSTPSFFAGALGIVALLAAKGEFAAFRNPNGVLPVLADTVIEPLLLFTASAGVYTIPALFLDHEIETGDITLGLLESLNKFGLYGRMFLDRLHFSAVPAFALAALFLFLHWLERSWTRRQTAATRKAWSVLHPAMKWANRVAMAALFIASFSFLAVHQNRSLVDAGLRDFKHRYSEFQDKVDQRIEPVFKRELIANAWNRLDERGKETIREAVRNRKAFHSLEEAYQALSGLGLDDRQTGNTISGMRPPDFSKEPRARRGGPAEERARLPAGLEHVWLSALRRVNILEFPSKTTVPEPLEEVKEMDSTVGTGLIDIVTDNPNNQRLVQWLSIHLPGLDDILNSIKDAGGELVIEAMKQARERVIQRNLESPRSALNELVADEARAAAARVPLHPVQLTERSPSIMAERSTIQKAEAALRREAPKAIRAALEASKTKSDHMAVQMKRLDERYPFLNLSTPGYVPSKSWEFDALQSTPAQEDGLRSLEKIGPFADGDSIDKLRRQLQTEQYYENLLAELAGREQNEVPEIRTILGGPELDRYLKIYETRLKERLRRQDFF